MAVCELFPDAMDGKGSYMGEELIVDAGMIAELCDLSGKRELLIGGRGSRRGPVEEDALDCCCVDCWHSLSMLLRGVSLTSPKTTTQKQ